MSLTRTSLLLVLATIACSETPPTVVEVELEADGPLEVMVPVVSAEDLVDVIRVERTPPSGPALVDEGADLENSQAQIFDPRTGVSFGGGYAAAIGRHDYIGNVGRVQTTAHVAFQDQHLGSQSADRQDFTPFLLDFGRVKNIWVRAQVFTDKECGLSVQGESRHAASWQFFQGPDVSSWGDAFITSQRRPTSQGACGETRSDRDPTGSDLPAQGFTCTYLITYDMNTGEILHVERLYCTTSGELI